MPFYLRKSISVGPFRFNLSKSGVGLSVGVRGLRIGTGPRGHYIHAGANGFYYRASLGHAGQKPPRSSQPARFQTPSQQQLQPVDNVEMVDIESGDVLEMTDARFQDVIDEINRKARQVRTSLVLGLSTALLAFLGWSMTQNPWMFAIVPPGYLLGYWLDSYQRTTVLFYELDPTLADLYQRFVAAFETMARCHRTWHIPSGGQVRDIATWKRNAGAGYLIKRNLTTLSQKLPAVVKCNFDPPHVRVGKQELYFFPDFALVLASGKAGAVTYDRLEMRVEPSRFIEDGDVPSDAQVVGQTWLHPNKRGGPDRRFASNRQIPVCLYEAVHFSSSTRLNELIELSKVGVAEGFATIARALGEYSPVAKSSASRPPPLPPPRHTQSASSEVGSRWAANAAFVVSIGIAMFGWAWWQLTTREPERSAPPSVPFRAVQQSPAQPKSIINSPPAKSVTTGSLPTRTVERIPPPTSAAIDVTLTISIQGADKPVVVGRANLPSGTELMISLRRPESAYFAQSKATVAEGQFRAGPFSQKGGPLNSGGYQVEVSSPAATFQPASVRAVIGQRGENLRGPSTTIAFGERVVTFSQNVTIEGVSASSRGRVKTQKADRGHCEAWYDCAIASGGWHGAIHRGAGPRSGDAFSRAARRGDRNR
jgi:Protein of unknown function (DUF4236)